jgi:hypothetical protein
VILKLLPVEIQTLLGAFRFAHLELAAAERILVREHFD